MGIKKPETKQMHLVDCTLKERRVCEFSQEGKVSVCDWLMHGR